MRKTISILLALCLLCTAAAAPAEVPSFDDTPGMLVEDENTVIEESAFEGNWVIDKTFANTEYIDPDTLASTYQIAISKVRIAEGKVFVEKASETGEVKTEAYAYTFEAGQLQSEENSELDFSFDLLEDGNICMSVFVPGEEEAPTCISLFLVRGEA